MTNLLKPLITEKSMTAASAGVYTFAVTLAASKPQIKSEIEALYDVHVTKLTLHIIKNPAKRVGRRRLLASQSPLKIARVWLKEGESIALFDLKEG